MKNNLLNDMKTAATVFGTIRKARKDGQEVKIKQVKEIPLITGGIGRGFYDTIEGCAIAGVGSNLDRKIVDAARKAFNELPEDEKTLFSCAPKDGEYIRRYQYWRSMLSPVLAPKQCNKAMYAILQWFIHLKHMKSAAPSAGQLSKIK